MEVIPGKVYAHHGGDRYTTLFLADESTNARKGSMGVVYISLT